MEDTPGILILLGNFATMQLTAHAQNIWQATAQRGKAGMGEMQGEMSRKMQEKILGMEDTPGILILVGNFAIMQLAAHAQVTEDQMGSGAELAGLEQEIVRLDICMDDAAGVQMGQSLSHLSSDVRELELPKVACLSMPAGEHMGPSVIW